MNGFEDMFDSPAGQTAPPVADVHLNLSLTKQLGEVTKLVDNDKDLGTKDRVALLAKLATIEKTIAQNDKLKRDAPSEGDERGVIIVPAKVPIKEWEAFATEEVSRARAEGN